MKKYIGLLILLFLLPAWQKINAQTTPKIQIALLLDTSNSMDGLIDQTKAQLWKIVNEMSMARYDGETPDLYIALYEYGNDALPSSEGYIRQLSQLTTDLDKISEELFALTTNGGSEFCGRVIQVAFNQLDWSKSNKDLKVIFIAGNEPFTQGRVDYRKACAKALENDIIVNTIFCGEMREGINSEWKAGSDIGGGKFMNIDQSIQATYIDSPYDDKIMELNNSLNDTYIYYGRSGKKMKERQKRQDKLAADYGQSNSVNRAISKSSKNYRAEKWDLVDAVENDEDIDIEEVEEEYLPEEMQKMNQDERKKHITKKGKERKKIQQEIELLNQKRRAYVSKKRKEDAQNNTLDEALIHSIKDLAKKKNYTFKK